MATFHLAEEPKEGRTPDPKSCPIVPQDVTAESEDDAVRLRELIVADDAEMVWQSTLQRTGSEAAADRAAACADEWQVVARLVAH